MQLDLTASKAAFEPIRPARLVSHVMTAGAVLGLALGLASCSAIDSLPGVSSLFGGEKYETKILPDIPADDIYNQGLARLHKKDYAAAGKSFGDLEKQYPYSGWSRKGLIMTTFSQYEEGKYEDAISSANRYVSLYPSSPETPYAIYLAGMSYYNQIPDVARDQEQPTRGSRCRSRVTSSPARRWVSAASTCSDGIGPRRSTASVKCSASTR
jgi:outer membrane protein assembly factor BamD